MSLLGSAGFDLYQSDPDNLTSQLSRLTSPILSPLTHAEDDDSSIHLLDLSAPSAISSEAGAVLTRSRSSTDASVKSAASSPVHLRRLADLSLNDEDVSEASEHKPPLTRSQSHSPSGCEVRVLDPDLTCIGLSDDSVDMWGLKIVKLIAFPDLVSPTQAGPSTPRRPSLNAAGLASVVTLGVDVVHAADISCLTEDADPLSLSEGESDRTSRLSEFLTDEEYRASSESPIFDVDEGKPWDEARYDDDDADESSEDEESAINTPEIHSNLHRPSLSHIDSDQLATTCSRSDRRTTRRASRTSPPPAEAPLVPFFSFTRTPEGSSLTAPVGLLASLFPAGERHMVICSGELDLLDSRAGSPYDEGERIDGVELSDDTFDLPETEGTLKCLQIDLRKFGLGEHA